MRSTGEVMAIDEDFGMVFAKAQIAAQGALPRHGRAFLALARRDCRAALHPARLLVDRGFELLSDGETAKVLLRHGIRATTVEHGVAGDIDDLIHRGLIGLVVDTRPGPARRRAGPGVGPGRRRSPGEFHS
ncbi:hypothetical protein [Micromonospora sp. NPDC049102]|uniref:hypothetical protein n=1 Tax=Micromonospora sp. NPDC049102 TaxID=3364265 RepID=UPI0037139E76